MTIGELTAYISCITLILSEIVNSIEPLINGVAYFKQASKRFNYFFNLETYEAGGEILEKVEKIEIKNLTYSYDIEESPALEDVSLEINKGEKIGIIRTSWKWKNYAYECNSRIFRSTQWNYIYK